MPSSERSTSSRRKQNNKQALPVDHEGFRAAVTKLDHINHMASSERAESTNNALNTSYNMSASPKLSRTTSIATALRTLSKRHQPTLENSEDEDPVQLATSQPATTIETTDPNEGHHNGKGKATRISDENEEQIFDTSESVTTAKPLTYLENPHMFRTTSLSPPRCQREDCGHNARCS